MPRKAQFPPPLYHWRERGLAFSKWQGKRVYFGPWGNDPNHCLIETRIAWDDWVKTLDHPIARIHRATAQCGATIRSVMLRYVEHCKKHYGDGPRTGAASAELAIREILSGAGVEIGFKHPDKFTPRDLIAIRDGMVKRKAKSTGKPLARSTINARVAWIKRAARWAVQQGYMHSTTWQALEAVQGLGRGRGGAREPEKRQPASLRDVEAVIPYMAPVVAAMVRFQVVTGARSGSIVQAQPDQFRRDDSDPELLIWTPRHKTEYRGAELVIPLGPKAQEIIGPYLERKPWCFKPGGARGKDRWTPWTYRRSIVRAQDKAIQAAQKARAKLEAEGGDPDTVYVPRVWTPHQLRHLRGHEVRTRYGIEAAQAALGHENLRTTEIYSAKRLDLARQVAREIG